jgi:hypothetical protein
LVSTKLVLVQLANKKAKAIKENINFNLFIVINCLQGFEVYP